MLLTGSQVSMALSSAIVFIFTFLLFLSGYVLQRQTVRGLQDIILPRLPTPTPKVIKPAVVAIPFGNADDLTLTFTPATKENQDPDTSADWVHAGNADGLIGAERSSVNDHFGLQDPEQAYLTLNDHLL